ncbi:MAG: hypothetical protein IM338_02150, partial [Microcystis sp. M055S1]
MCILSLFSTPLQAIAFPHPYKRSLGKPVIPPSLSSTYIAIDILTAVKRTAIPHHATFLEWSLNGVDATRDAASLTEVLRFPTRPFKVSECPPATLI